MLGFINPKKNTNLGWLTLTFNEQINPPRLSRVVSQFSVPDKDPTYDLVTTSETIEGGVESLRDTPEKALHFLDWARICNTEVCNLILVFVV